MWNDGNVCLSNPGEFLEATSELQRSTGRRRDHLSHDKSAAGNLRRRCWGWILFPGPFDVILITQSGMSVIEEPELIAVFHVSTSFRLFKPREDPLKLVTCDGLNYLYRPTTFGIINFFKTISSV